MSDLADWNPFDGERRPLGDWLDSLSQAESEDELWELITRQSPPPTRVERQQVRGLLIKILKARFAEFESDASPAKTADAWLADGTAAEAEDELQGQALAWEDEDAWPETVAGNVLDEVAGVYGRYVHTTRENLTALTLWTVLAHGFDAFGISPILDISSPTKRCGKSSTLVVLRRLVHRSLLSGNISPAALFRAVEAWRPTLLIDEADSFLRMADELRGILNAGHTRDTAFTVRAEGERNEPRVFSTWAPKAVAAIGRLPDTVEDRAIRVALSRKPSSVQTEDAFDTEAVAAVCAPVRRRVARFVLDHLGEMTAAKPERPDGLDDRAWNNWRPLMAVAEVAGGDWPERARACSVALAGGDESETEDVGTLALHHVWEVLEPVEAIPTADLLARLVENEDGPWAKWWAKDVAAGELKGPGAKLAKILKPFGVKPRQLWIDGAKHRGYDREAFRDTCATYLENNGRDGRDGRTGSTKQAVSTNPTAPTVFSDPPRVHADKRPFPGDEMYPLFIAEMGNGGHITESEFEKLLAVHRLVVQGARAK